MILGVGRCINTLGMGFFGVQVGEKISSFVYSRKDTEEFNQSRMDRLAILVSGIVISLLFKGIQEFLCEEDSLQCRVFTIGIFMGNHIFSQKIKLQNIAFNRFFETREKLDLLHKRLSNALINQSIDFDSYEKVEIKLYEIENSRNNMPDEQRRNDIRTLREICDMMFLENIVKGVIVDSI